MDASARRLAVLDLFSGCGGFSLGFSRAGFDIVGGIELDPDAERTHSMNLPPKVQPNHSCDIQKVAGDEVTQPLSSPSAAERIKVDVIIGGPPCQPFTRVGRAKLREVAERVHAHSEGKRVPLFTHFLRFVAELRPLAFVMENVYHLASFAGRNIAEEVAVSASTGEAETRQGIVHAKRILL